MNGSMNYKRATVLLIFLFLLPVAATAGSQWETKEIIFENESVNSGTISGDYIILLTVGEGFNQSLNRINLYNIDSGEHKITGIPSEGMTVTGEGLSGDYAVWFETRTMDIFDQNESGAKSNYVYLMEISENNTTVLDLPEDAEWPKITGNKIFWLNSSENSFETEFYMYDIATGESDQILTTDCVDSADLKISDGNIAYENQTSLHLYNIESGRDTVIFEYEYSNESGTNIDSFDMSGDYLIYIMHSMISKGDDKGVYYEPVLYTISANKTESLNPKTGEISESVTLADQKTQLVSPFTDGSRAGWSYQDSDSESKIILFDPATENASTITATGSVGDISLDDNRIIWTKSVFPSFSSSLVYAEENATEEEIPSKSTPGFPFIACFSGILAAVLIYAGSYGKRKF
jgi:hypothetical protein